VDDLLPLAMGENFHLKAVKKRIRISIKPGSPCPVTEEQLGHEREANVGSSGNDVLKAHGDGSGPYHVI